jgi:hypothetical protein
LGYKFEIRDRHKGAVGEAAKFLFAPRDHAEGDVLENTVVGKEGKNPFGIVG